MSDEAWKTAFEIKMKHEDFDDPEFGMMRKSTYDVVNTLTGEVVANYRDYSYARKQARRKYKKIVRLMEKSFMS